MSTLSIKYTESGTIAGNAVSYTSETTIGDVWKCIHFKYMPFVQNGVVQHSDFIYRRNLAGKSGIIDNPENAEILYGRFTNLATGSGSYDIIIEITRVGTATDDNPFHYRIRPGESLVLLPKGYIGRTSTYQQSGSGFTNALDNTNSYFTSDTEISTIKCRAGNVGGQDDGYLEVLLALDGSY